MQHDTLMEKGVILDEVNTLTSQLREEAATARSVGASLAAAANAYQERLRKVTRGMMATISELSLYQVWQPAHGIGVEVQLCSVQQGLVVALNGAVGRQGSKACLLACMAARVAVASAVLGSAAGRTGWAAAAA